MFTITVTEATDRTDSNNPVQRYTQTVDRLDLSALIAAVNTPPPAPKKARSDKGKPKPRKQAPVTQPLGI